MFSFLFGCSFFGHQPSPDEQLVNEITEKTALKLKDQKNLYLVGTGGQMMNDIQMLMMGFNFYKVVDINAARELLIYCVGEFLTAINSNEEIRPYLHNYPFLPQNVEIVIYFYNPDGSTVSSDKVKIAAINHGELVYYVDYPEKHTLKTLYEETYEAALKLTTKRTG